MPPALPLAPPSPRRAIQRPVTPDTRRPRKRQRWPVEDDAYSRFLGRAVRALGRRAAQDPESLVHLRELRREVDAATQAAVDGCRAAGYSWAAIGRGLGMTRGSAHELYGRARD